MYLLFNLSESCQKEEDSEELLEYYKCDESDPSKPKFTLSEVHPYPYTGPDSVVSKGIPHFLVLTAFEAK